MTALPVPWPAVGTALLARPDPAGAAPPAVPGVADPVEPRGGEPPLVDVVLVGVLAEDSGAKADVVVSSVTTVSFRGCRVLAKAPARPPSSGLRPH
jgi:hypothetical protein